MVGDVVLGIIIVLINALISHLPDAVLPSTISNALDSLQGYFAGLAAIVPIATILDILFFVIVFEGLYASYKGIMWLVKRFPTQS